MKRKGGGKGSITDRCTPWGYWYGEHQFQQIELPHQSSSSRWQRMGSEVAGCSPYNRLCPGLGLRWNSAQTTGKSCDLVSHPPNDCNHLMHHSPCWVVLPAPCSELGTRMQSDHFHWIHHQGRAKAAIFAL